MTVKSLRTPWRSETLSNRADSFFYSLVGVWNSLNALSPNENRTWCFWWDTLLYIHGADIKPFFSYKEFVFASFCEMFFQRSFRILVCFSLRYSFIKLSWSISILMVGSADDSIVLEKSALINYSFWIYIRMT
jgi:hypothetical protein